MSEPVIGLQLFTLRDFIQTTEQIAETLPRVAAIGYESVQISGIRGDFDALAIARIAADCGLAVASTHTTMDQLQTQLQRVVEEYQILGAHHVAVGGLVDPHLYYSADGLERFIDEVKDVSSKLAPFGMDFSFHNHWPEMIRIGDKTWFEAVLDRTTADELKLEIDTYWIQAGGGDPAEYIRKCRGRIPLLHVKDIAVSMESEGKPFQIEVGCGNLNWPSIIAQTREAGVEHVLVEQASFNGLDPFESIAISYRNLRQMMEQGGAVKQASVSGR